MPQNPLTTCQPDLPTSLTDAVIRLDSERVDPIIPFPGFSPPLEPEPTSLRCT